MDKKILNAAVTAAKFKTRDALQKVYDSLNHGQQKQIVKDADIKAMFDLYGVKYED